MIRLPSEAVARAVSDDAEHFYQVWALGGILHIHPLLRAHQICAAQDWPALMERSRQLRKLVAMMPREWAEQILSARGASNL